MMRWTKRAGHFAKTSDSKGYPRAPDRLEFPRYGAGTNRLGGRQWILLLAVVLLAGWGLTRCGARRGTEQTVSPPRADYSAESEPVSDELTEPVKALGQETIEETVVAPVQQEPTARSTVPVDAAEAQRAAIRRYPELGVAKSRFNREFLARYKKYRQNDPEFLRNPSWPLILADETAQAVPSSVARPRRSR